MSNPIGPELPGMRFVDFLGAGGFADVYLYERDQPRIKVAVKIMKPGALTEAQRRQFAAEADTMALLAEHPFIVPVLGAGTSEDGRPFLVMTYYPSSDLAARVSASPMSVAEALRYGIQLASAVETAHRAGVIHRDIKPSNILMSSYGVMGLSDFGIAGRPTDLGQDDDVGISLPWSPREVVVGESNGSVQSDVYSLAATIWHLLMGRAPFNIPGGDNSERATVTRIVHQKPPSLERPDVPPSLDRVLQQALSKSPEYRPQSALELARHFQRIEQELRLARTEIVVLDQESATGVQRPSMPSPDRTQLRDRSAVPSPMASAPTAPGATAPMPDQDTGATELKPPPRVVGQAPRPSPSTLPDPIGRTKPPRVFDKVTDVRPQRVDATPTVAPADEARPPRRGRLIVAACLLLAGAVGGGLALSSGTSPSHSSVSQPPVDPLGGSGTLPQLPAPVVQVKRATAKAVVFQWTTVHGASFYGWQRDSDAAPTPVKETTATVPRSAGRTCVVVRASNGAYGLPSGRVCG